MTSVAIVGYGFVGKAMHKLFPDAYIYDIGNGATRQGVSMCDVAFICVPTPNNASGALDTSAVEDVLSWCNSSLIVIRSTVNPGNCSRWARDFNSNIVYQPEYLGETTQHPFLELSSRPFLIIGGRMDDRRKLIELYQGVYNANIHIRQMSWIEAEIIKLSENRAIAFKIAQCQELYDACEAAGLDYYVIREAVYGDDPRFTLWWTFVYPDRRGMQSKCLPKDVYAWAAWAESIGADASVTRAILERNRRWVNA